MWLFELFLLSLVCGTVVGFGIRAWDEMTENLKKEQVDAALGIPVEKHWWQKVGEMISNLFEDDGEPSDRLISPVEDTDKTE